MTLIANLTPRSYESLYADILRPMHALFVSGTTAWRAAWLETLGRLIAAWASVDWVGWREGGGGAGGDWPRCPFPFGPPPARVDYFRVLRSLLAHADQLCALALQASGDHPTVQAAVGGLLSIATRLRSDWGAPFVAAPGRAIVYRFLLAPTSFGPSVMAGILARYLGEFKSLIEFREKTSAARESGCVEGKATHCLKKKKKNTPAHNHNVPLPPRVTITHTVCNRRAATRRRPTCRPGAPSALSRNSSPWTTWCPDSQRASSASATTTVSCSTFPARCGSAGRLPTPSKSCVHPD
jgi:hypothetical protein